MSEENQIFKYKDSKAPGHWLLAKLGKKVLRPGGRNLTKKLLEALEINNNDDVVEFAPGLGFTAEITLNKNPRSYTAIEQNKSAADYIEKNVLSKYKNGKVIVGNAMNTGLEDSCASKLYGEAMLTMQPDNLKAKIINEAYRLLRKDGLYAIHEIAFIENENDDSNLRNNFYKELKESIHVNATPLTKDEWINIFNESGFKIKNIITSPMHLLEPKRIIEDEGFFRFLLIQFRMLTNSEARKRVFNMRRIFKKYEKNMTAIAIVSQK